MSYGSGGGGGEAQPHTPYEPTERPMGRPASATVVRRVALATAGAIAVATAVVAFRGKEAGSSGGAFKPPAKNHIFEKFERTPDTQEVLGPEGAMVDMADDMLGEEANANLPHIVYMLVDDMGWNDVGYQSTDLQGVSPHIDELAAKGVKLTSFYTQHLCTPTRASLMTGKYSIRTGLMHDEVIAPMSPWGLSLDYKLLPQYLAGMGYKTHMVGKWHLGHYMFDFYPTKRGFDSFYGYVTDQEHYYNHTYAFQIVGTWWQDMCKATPQNYTLLPQVQGELSTILYRDQVRDLLAQHKPKEHPLFLYYASQNVHGPLDDIADMSIFTADQIKALESIPTAERRIFGKLVGALDHAVHDLVQTLKKHDMWERSVLIFSSDNGGCEYGGGYNTPLRGGKHFLFEGGLRVPAFVHSPMFPDTVKGTEYGGLFHITDMFATIIAMTGHDLPPKIDGVDQWDALQGLAEPPRTEIIHNIDYWTFPTPTTSSTLEMMKRPRAALRQGDMKLILHHWQLPWSSPPEKVEDGTNASKPLNQGVVDCGTPPEGNLPIDWLFNITADPEERFNLFNEPEYADLVSSMRAKIMMEAQNMNMASWMNEDPTAIQTWMHSGFIEPWMTKSSLPAPDYMTTEEGATEDSPEVSGNDGQTGGLDGP